MTPREKAEELFIKYRYAIRTEETQSGFFTNVIKAKQCALIAVSEFINQIDKWSLSEPIMFIDISDYWQEVKQEIEKL